MTRDELKSLLSYDEKTGVFTWLKSGKVAGGLDKDGYCVIYVRGKRYRAGRLAWLFVHGVWPKNEIDHDNRIRNDDRLENLKPATRLQNNQNRKPVTKPGRHKGVHVSQNAKLPWRSIATINGKVTYLGDFLTQEEALAKLLSVTA